MRSKIESMSGLFPIGSVHNDFTDINKIHLERTLDEAYYPGLSAERLKSRNQGQIVSKAFKESPKGDEEHAPILLVPQLWLWRLDNYVVSAFASSEKTKSNHYFRAGSDHRVQSTVSPDLHMGLIIASRIKAFGTTYEHDDGKVKFPPTLNIFEMAMVSILSNVDEYLRPEHSGLDAGKEGEFIQDISAIRSQLAMIQDVLNQQEEVLNGLLNDPARDDVLGSNTPFERDHIARTRSGWVKVEEARDMILEYRKRTEKIDRDTERIQLVIQDKLNVKRTAASMEQARASVNEARASTRLALASVREARESKLLSIVVIAFTIISLIFTPLSFLTSLFSLDIDTFSGIKYTPDGGTSDVFSGKKLIEIFRKCLTFDPAACVSLVYVNFFIVGVEILTILLTVCLAACSMPLLLWALKKWHWGSESESEADDGKNVGKDEETRRVDAKTRTNLNAMTGANVGASTGKSSNLTMKIAPVQSEEHQPGTKGQPDEKQDEPPRDGLSFRRFFGAEKKRNASTESSV
jgi:hypothetical protein